MDAASSSNERTPLLDNISAQNNNERALSSETSGNLTGNIQRNRVNLNTTDYYQAKQKKHVTATEGNFNAQQDMTYNDKGNVSQNRSSDNEHQEKCPASKQRILSVIHEEPRGNCSGGLCLQRVYICLVVSLYYFAIMIDDEAWPQLVRSRVVKDMGVNLSQIKSEHCAVNITVANNTDVQVQKRSATINTYFLMAAYIPAIFSNLVIGKLSDKFGRKIGLFTAITGAILKYSSIAVCIHYDLDIDISYAGFILYGLSGTYTVASQTSNACAADITEAGKERTFFFSVIAFFKGFTSMLGQILVGYIMQYVGQFFVYVIAIGVMVCTFFIVAFCLSGSRQKQSGNLDIKHNEESHQPTTENKRDVFTRSTRAIQCALLAAYILTCLRDEGLTTVASLYVLDSPFCWTSVKIGWLLSMFTGCELVGVFLVGLFQKCVSDVTIVTTGTIMTAASFFIFTFAYDDIMIFSVPIVGFMGDLGYPLTSAMLSGVTSPDKQGFVFSLLGLVESAGTLFSGLCLNTLYFATVGWMNGFVFLLAAVICLLCVPLYMYYSVASSMDRRDGTKPTTSSSSH